MERTAGKVAGNQGMVERGEERKLGDNAGSQYYADINHMIMLVFLEGFRSQCSDGMYLYPFVIFTL